MTTARANEWWRLGDPDWLRLGAVPEPETCLVRRSKWALLSTKDERTGTGATWALISDVAASWLRCWMVQPCGFVWLVFNLHR